MYLHLLKRTGRDQHESGCSCGKCDASGHSFGVEIIRLPRRYPSDDAADAAISVLRESSFSIENELKDGVLIDRVWAHSEDAVMQKAEMICKELRIRAFR